MATRPNYRIRTHQGLPYFVCLRCDYVALSENQLLIHMQMIHHEHVLIPAPAETEETSP